MKKLYSITILFISLLFYNCEKNDSENLQVLQMDGFDLTDMKLNIDFEFGKEIQITKENLNKLIINDFEEISKADNSLIFLFTIKNNKTFYSINNKKSLIKKKSKEKQINLSKGDPSGFYDEEATCKTCASEDCIKSAIADGVGAGNDQVFIAVTPKKKYGVRYGIEVCYAYTVEALVESL